MSREIPLTTPAWSVLQCVGKAVITHIFSDGLPHAPLKLASSQPTYGAPRNIMHTGQSSRAQL